MTDLLLLDVVIKDQKEGKEDQSSNGNEEIQLALGIKDPAYLFILLDDAIQFQLFLAGGELG